MKTTYPIGKIVRREFRRMMAHRSSILVTIIVPLIVFPFLTYIYRDAIVREIPVVVYDADNTALSRLLCRSIDGASTMAIERYAVSSGEMREEILKGKAHAAFYIPKGMEEDIKRGVSSTIVIEQNSNNLIIGNTILRDAVTISKTVSGGILLKKLGSAGLGPGAAMNIISPVRVEMQTLFNGNYSYLNYLVPGLLVAVLQMIILVSGVCIVNSEFSQRSFHELVSIAGDHPALILAGKSIPYFLIHTATALGVIGILFPLFGIEIFGSVIGSILFTVFFVLVLLSVGVMLSVIFKDQMLATEISLIITSPAFLFSGFTYPSWAMPPVHIIWGQLMPSTHFLMGFLKIYQMGAPMKYALPEVFKLSLFLIVSAAISIIVLRLRIKHEPDVSNLPDEGETL